MAKFFKFASNFIRALVSIHNERSLRHVATPQNRLHPPPPPPPLFHCLVVHQAWEYATSGMFGMRQVHTVFLRGNLPIILGSSVSPSLGKPANHIGVQIFKDVRTFSYFQIQSVGLFCL